MTCSKILLLLALLATLSFCRKYETSVKFSQLKQHNGWYYLEKFKFAEGVARFDVQLYVRGKGKSKSNHQIYIQGIPSDKWEAELEQKCQSSIKMPVIIKNIRMTGQKVADKFQFSVSQEDTYYFVIKDCLQLFRKDYDNDNLVLHIKFHAFSNDVELDDGPDQLNPPQEEQSQPIIEYDSEQEAKARQAQAAEASKNAEGAQTVAATEATETAQTTENTESSEATEPVQTTETATEEIRQVNEVVEQQEQSAKVIEEL